MMKPKKERGGNKSLIVRAIHALLGPFDPCQKDIKNLDWPKETKAEEAWRIDSFLRLQADRYADQRKFPRYADSSGNLRNTSYS